eukprot:5782718-Pyramimonas_sp.AAC.1
MYKSVLWRKYLIGRPVGFLDAWLDQADAGGVVDKATHCASKLQRSLTFDSRNASRDAAKRDDRGIAALS